MKIPPLLTPAALLASFNMSNHDAATSTVPGVPLEYLDESSSSYADSTRHYVCPLNDCHWALVVTLRDEACILDENKDGKQPSNSLDANTSSLCPLLVDGYSVSYETATAEASLLFSRVTSPANTSLAIFLLAREKYLEFTAEQHESYTYGDLVKWSQKHADVYYGFATQFSELTVYDNTNHSVEGFSASVEGYVTNSRGYRQTFHLQAQQQQGVDDGNDEDKFWHVEVEESRDHACLICNFGNKTIVLLELLGVGIISCTLFFLCLYREVVRDDDSLWQQEQEDVCQKQRDDTFEDDSEDDEASSVYSA